LRKKQSWLCKALGLPARLDLFGLLLLG